MAAVTPAKKNAKAKSVAIKKPRAHPPYVEMINEAISALKERTGSSQYAIAKFIEEKQKDLPPNFKKFLHVQLKKLVASGKLTKVKNSFKLSAPVKVSAAPPAAAKKAAPEKKAVDKKKVVAKPKKATASIPVKVKKVAGKPKAKSALEKKPKKVAKTAKVTTPAKKKPVKKAAPVKVKKTPVKKVKSLKSPAKKVALKKGKK